MTEAQEILQAIRGYLSDGDYESAEHSAELGVKQFGTRGASQFYSLIWLHAIANGNPALGKRYLIAQSNVDVENRVGASLRRQQLKMAAEAPPLPDQPLDKAKLGKLAASPDLADSWHLWQESIDRVHGYLTHGSSRYAAEDAESGPADNRAQTILTAGSGRSGSSAIYDWLMGYAGFQGVRAQHLHLRDFAATLTSEFDSPAYRKKVVDILWKTFLGRYTYNSKSSHRRAALARRVLRELGDIKPANACLTAIVKLTSQATTGESLPEGNRPSLARMPEFVSIIKDLFAPPGKRLVANGWLDFVSAEVYPYLTNAKIVCSIRDPRDVYAEHILLTRSFNGDVDSFINNYRAKLHLLKKVIEDSKALNVFPIRFEELVLSADTRSELAQKLEFDLRRPARKKPEYAFIPENSARNIGIFRHCREKEAIEKIASELSEYCF